MRPPANTHDNGAFVGHDVFHLTVRHEVADVAVLRAEDHLTAPAVLPAVSCRDVRRKEVGCEAPGTT